MRSIGIKQIKTTLNRVNMSNTNYSASNFKPKTKVKISEPGIYSGLTFTNVNYIDNESAHFEFEREDGSYCDIRLFLKINPELITKGQTTLFSRKNKVPSGKEFDKAIEDAIVKAEQDVLVKLNEIALALGDEDDVYRIVGKSYMDLAEKIISYIEKIRKPNEVNVKLTMDYKDEWVELSRKAGSIEKHIPGTSPKLRFTAYEIDNNKDKRPVKTGSSIPGAASFNAAPSPFSSPVSSPFTNTTISPGTATFSNGSSMSDNAPHVVAKDDDLPF